MVLCQGGIEMSGEKIFKPFVVDVPINMIQEARLLYHVFNRLFLRDAIMTEAYTKCIFESDMYLEKKEVSSHFPGEEISNKIKDIIKEQGFFL